MLAGYITARTTYLARVEVYNKQPRISRYEKYNNHEFSNFDEVLSLFMRKNEGVDQIVCLGVAGPVINNAVTATNIPWKISQDHLIENFKFQKARLVNDIEATASGLFHLKEDKFYTINKGVKVQNGNIGLIAPGNGLGQGLLFYDKNKYCPYPSEGGHSGFSPGNQLEVGLWEYLYNKRGFVEAEDVLSREGLISIYEYLVMTKRTEKGEWFLKSNDKPVDLIEKALSGSDETAVAAIDMFIDCLATETANLALKGMTLGGIYLAGELPPQLLTMLDSGRFMDRFRQKGKLEGFLSKIPVEVIIDDKTALFGSGCLVAELA